MLGRAASGVLGRTASGILERRNKVTAEELLANSDLTGKTVVVTGGNSGLGKETARVLALAGARVIFTSRKPEVAQQVVAELSSEPLKGQLVAAQMDLRDLHSVRAFAQQLHQERSIDVLILNAGVMGIPLGYTQHGFEKHMGTNHFGHFCLFQSLEQKLAAQKTETRVIVVTCGAHSANDHWKGVDLADMHYTDGRRYDKMHAYAQSKSANILLAKQIAARHEGTSLKAYAVDPGAAKTELQRHITVANRIKIRVAHPNYRSIPQAAASIVYAATDPELANQSGAYLANMRVSKPAKHCLDATTAERLWDESSAQVQIALSRQRISMNPAENAFVANGSDK